MSLDEVIEKLEIIGDWVEFDYPMDMWATIHDAIDYLKELERIKDG